MLMLRPINSSECTRGHIRFGWGCRVHFARCLTNKVGLFVPLDPGLNSEKMKFLLHVIQNTFQCNGPFYGSLTMLVQRPTIRLRYDSLKDSNISNLNPMAFNMLNKA